jgi:DNA-binding NarL/FixJ family response regulator
MGLEPTRHIKAAVVAPHPVTVAGLAAVVDAQPNMAVVATASSVAAGLPDILRTEANAAIVEIGPGIEGAPIRDLIDALRQHGGQMAIIAFTDEPRHVVTALKEGARGFLLKDCPTDEIVAGLHQAVRGAIPVSARTLPHLVSEVMSPTVAPALTMREREVLGLVARGQSNPRIAESLHVSEATVKTHMRRVFHKLDVSDRASAVAMAMSRGLLTLENRSAPPRPLSPYAQPGSDEGFPHPQAGHAVGRDDMGPRKAWG